MKKKIFVTLVSEQAIPNIQYIKEFEPFDTCIFITTKKMEEKRKVDSIVSACLIKENQFDKIEVEEDNLTDILSKLKSFFNQTEFVENECSYLVNCTLGTKIMSIALFDFFKNNENAKLLYSPIGKNAYLEIIDSEKSSGFTKKITIEEYAKGYGILVKQSKRLFRSEEYTNSFFLKYLEFTTDDFMVLKSIREYEGVNGKGVLTQIEGRKKGVKDITQFKGLSDFLLKIEFITEKEYELSKDEVVFLTGNWFEEWTYFQIKNLLNVDDTQIGIGIESLIEAGNDLDVVFILNNDLYIIECKTRLSKELEQSTIYKSGALVEKFGKAAKSYLFTLENLRDSKGDLKLAVDLRARQQNIIVLDRTDLICDKWKSKFAKTNALC